MSSIHKVLKDYFGYSQFRSHQEDVINTSLEGKDSLVLMPTGGGKSLCYQIPALVNPGVCIVVSPLIALMKDQVQGLLANGVPAAFLNSSLADWEEHEVTNQLLEGEIKLLYVSPERMVSKPFIRLMRELQISLFAIDEAHCVSNWGHDFRPEYTQLKSLREVFPGVPFMALTATADGLTRKDIVYQLGLRNHKEFISSFDRPNISLEVLPGKQRREALLEFIKNRPRTSGIVYCISRRNTEDVARFLESHDINAKAYHAGMKAQKRAMVQEAFISDKVPIVCATVAFGMGINKANVRWVVHYQCPKNLESYYQEIGRAGRDGLPSEALMFYSLPDIQRWNELMSRGGSKQLALNQAKLERMQQFTEARQCRRRMLLAYFGETQEEDCGNCDVCNDPPTYVDGTLVAQKALSAVYRLPEPVTATMLTDVLRGSQKKELLEKEYHKIKTYGIGSDISAHDWNQYLQQLINLGLLEVAYDKGNGLQLTEHSKDFLQNNGEVKLVKPISAKERARRTAEEKKPKTREEKLAQDLFVRLQALRGRLAETEGVTPEAIFQDPALKQMAAKMSTTPADMQGISGMSQRKYTAYGEAFINEIVGFVADKTEQGIRIERGTQLATYALYQRGLPLAEIARKRNLKEMAINSHIGQLYATGHEVDLLRFISQEDLDKVVEVIKKIGPNQLTAIQKNVGPGFDLGKVVLGRFYWQRHFG
ncbi:MAG: DNA helicase RecQ [Bacteroidota bacterium]